MRDTTTSGVLAVSSWVAAGHVGLSAAAPALRALGRPVTELPTVLLSNHPGFAQVAHQPMPVAALRAFVAAQDANGWGQRHGALLLGYMPTPAHVEFAAQLAADRAGTLRVIVDPILGDAPKGLYVRPEVAAAVRDRLVPLADVLTPNLFELGWLTGAPVQTLDQAAQAATALAAEAGAEVLVTSPPLGAGETGLLTEAAVYATPHLAGVPQGTGDVFSGLIAGGLPPDAALGHVAALARASQGAPHLNIAEALADWTAAAPCPPRPKE